MEGGGGGVAQLNTPLHPVIMSRLPCGQSSCEAQTQCATLVLMVVTQQQVCARVCVGGTQGEEMVMFE